MGLAVFTVGLFWLTGRSIKSTGVKAEVVFSNVSGLKQGDPVMVSGVKKGRVQSVKLERVGRVDVVLELASDVKPRVDASASVGSVERVMANLDTILGSGAGKRVDSLSNNLVALTNELSHATASLNGLLAKVNKWEGTLGRLASDSTLYNDLHKTLNALTDL